VNGQQFVGRQSQVKAGRLIRTVFDTGAAEYAVHVGAQGKRSFKYGASFLLVLSQVAGMGGAVIIAYSIIGTQFGKGKAG
jgi:hypothetical protein